MGKKERMREMSWHSLTVKGERQTEMEKSRERRKKTELLAAQCQLHNEASLVNKNSTLH